MKKLFYIVILLSLLTVVASPPVSARISTYSGSRSINGLGSTSISLETDVIYRDVFSGCLSLDIDFWMNPGKVNIDKAYVWDSEGLKWNLVSEDHTTVKSVTATYSVVNRSSYNVALSLSCRSSSDPLAQFPTVLTQQVDSGTVFEYAYGTFVALPTLSSYDNNVSNNQTLAPHDVKFQIEYEDLSFISQEQNTICLVLTIGRILDDDED